jgi:hypothetical protein
VAGTMLGTCSSELPITITTCCTWEGGGCVSSPLPWTWVPGTQAGEGWVAGGIAAASPGTAGLEGEG